MDDGVGIGVAGGAGGLPGLDSRLQGRGSGAVMLHCWKRES